MVLPRVVKFARYFYNCPTVDGMFIENDGGSGSKGSHWESLYARQDVII